MSYKKLELLENTNSSTENKDILQKSCNSLSYNEFFWQHMNENWPVVLTNVANSWECYEQWLTPPSDTDNGNLLQVDTEINFHQLKEIIGNIKVPVVNCNKDFYDAHEKIDMNLFDFLEYWEIKHKTDLKRRNNTSLNNKEDCYEIDDRIQNDRNKTFYLKDWHLQAKMPDYKFYTTPIYFAVDWLNEYLIDKNKDDYRFVYMGPKDSWTPFHTDVFGSFSWSTNICGLKKWTILPLGEEKKLADSLGNLPKRIFENDLKEKNVKYFSLIQKENEAIFVPSGWYHQVWNITDTISINHNWFNGCNILKIWENLSLNMQKVRKEIDDCKDMDNFDAHCQRMLKASFGMNYFGFLNLLEHIMEKRLGYNQSDAVHNSEFKSSKNIFFDLYQPNHKQILFDLQMLHKVAQQMLLDKVIFDDRLVLYRRCLRISELTIF